MNHKIFDFLKRNNSKIMSINKEVRRTDGTSTKYSPFFCTTTVRSEKIYNLDIVNGGILNSEYRESPLRAMLGIRMGDYLGGGSKSYETGIVLPRSLDEKVSDSIFIPRVTNAFWSSAEDMEKRFSKGLGLKKDRSDYLYFSKAPVENFIQKKEERELNIPQLEMTFSKLSKEFSDFGVTKNNIWLTYREVDDYICNSEGTQVFKSNAFFSTYFNFDEKSKEGIMIPYTVVFRSTNLPSYAELYNAGIMAIQSLREELRAPIQVNGEFPCILCGSNTGVFFHESAGHGLEGTRLQLSGENETNLFKDMDGEKIAPDFLNMVDNPKIKCFNGKPIASHYDFDDEGVRAEEVEMIKNGRLARYLHSRETAGFQKVSPNGHGRFDYSSLMEPTSRMGTLFISSSSPVSSGELRKKLAEECVKRGKPYGLYFKGKGSGWVMPSESFYNSCPQEVYRIYPNGKMKRVKNVSIMGTPHNALSNVMAMSDNYVLENGICGASSGDTVHSIIAPESVIRGLEVKRVPKEEYEKVYEEIFDKNL